MSRPSIHSKTRSQLRRELLQAVAASPTPKQAFEHPESLDKQGPETESQADQEEPEAG